MLSGEYDVNDAGEGDEAMESRDSDCVGFSMSIAVVAVLFVMVIGLMSGPVALAQEATPGASPDAATPQASPVAFDIAALSGPLPITPDPGECTVLPRPLADLPAASASTPESGSPPSGTPVALATPTGGAPADKATTQAVTVTLRLFLACLNAGDLPRVFAMSSDAYLSDLFGDTGLPQISEAYYAILATPAPPPASERVTIQAFEMVTLHPDGSVTARVSATSPEPVTNDVRFVPDEASPTGYVVDAQVAVAS